MNRNEPRSITDSLPEEAPEIIGNVLDRQAEISIGSHSRPHWMQANTITFITFRLADSIPREVILRWDRERCDYLQRQGIPRDGDWRSARQRLSLKQRAAFDKRFNRLREDELDSCHGSCLLKRPTAAKIVADSPLFFDGQRYRMGDFVIMPNHVHLLAAFCEQNTMRQVCYSWMKFTARELNHLVGGSGTVWQEEPFDHLVRSEEQLRWLRKYIAENPLRAGLQPGEYLYRRSNHHF